MVRILLQEFLQKELFRRGYEMVYTPHIGRVELYKTSGHYPYYEESQFPTMMMLRESAFPLVTALRDIRDGKRAALSSDEEQALVKQAGIDPAKYPWNEADPAVKHAFARALSQSGEDYLLKPMNCPHHIKIFASEARSYRGLPLRLAEFGTVYRFEQSGELSGLTRVRGFTQDDAHIFCTHEQVKGEFRATIELVQFVFTALGFKDVQIRLSKHDSKSEKFAGNKEVWLQAEAEIRDVLTEMQVAFEEAEGEAAFYGPKVDFLVRDVIGRKWQLGTVQLDYVLPERFALEYTGADNRPHRPVMIHRAPFGSMERFMGILIEHFNGAFPLWLAPVQVTVLSISEKHNAYAEEIHKALQSAGLRATADLSADKIGSKIRLASVGKTPLMLVIGEKEQTDRTVTVRPFFDVPDAIRGTMNLGEFISQVASRVADRWHPTGEQERPPAEAGGPAGA
jgi:threonyl-tRNA synthetase